MDPMAKDGNFFSALLAADAGALNQILSDDFILVDVMSGSEIPKPVIVDLVGSGTLRFLSIEPSEQSSRTYGATAVVIGRTYMTGEYQGQAWEAASRYTHVYASVGGVLRLVSAQGTPINSI
jgi:ketosteroid isomerase-like protein